MWVCVYVPRSMSVHNTVRQTYTNYLFLWRSAHAYRYVWRYAYICIYICVFAFTSWCPSAHTDFCIYFLLLQQRHCVPLQCCSFCCCCPASPAKYITCYCCCLLLLLRPVVLRMTNVLLTSHKKRSILHRLLSLSVAPSRTTSHTAHLCVRLCACLQLASPYGLLSSSSCGFP